MTWVARVDETVRAIRELGVSRVPSVGVVLGSGLGAFADTLEGLVKVPYARLPHLPSSAVPGHSGHLCFGEVAGVPVVCMQGRAHLYEGHPVEAAVHGARTMARLGATRFLLTNAAGGLEPTWSPGDLMVLDDHLNLTGMNPLSGRNDDAIGPRFLDMTRAYDAELSRALHEVAGALKTALRSGVYAALLGPSYETPAEVRMLRILGAHAVGMSTALETIALRHMGARVAAMSCITNLAAGLSPTLLDHAEVEATARARREAMVGIVSAWIARVGAP